MKQHSSLHASTHSCVSSISVQSLQKVVNDRMYGTSNAILASRLTTLIIRKMNPNDFLICETPIINIAVSASSKDKIPRTKPRMCGKGPLKSIDNQIIMDDSRNIAAKRKRIVVMQARPTTSPGTLAILILLLHIQH